MTERKKEQAIYADLVYGSPDIIEAAKRNKRKRKVDMMRDRLVLEDCKEERHFDTGIDVHFLSVIDDPMTNISRAAGTCYGKHNASMKRVVNCFKSGHDAVLEFAWVSFIVSGISRACSHQLVRHRLFSIMQESQRYCKVDTNCNTWYVVPQEIKGNKSLEKQFHNECVLQGAAYRHALEVGVKPQDARYYLPEATKTTVTIGCNIRELFHFFDLRLDNSAQWEIRELAELVLSGLDGINDEYHELVEMYKAGVR